MAPIYNRAAAIGRMDGDESFFQELVDLFLADYPRLLQAVRGAVGSGDADRLMRAAHNLKGSIVNFASQPGYEAALRLEQIGASGRLEAAQPALDALVAVVEQLASALAQPVAEAPRLVANLPEN